MPIDLAVQSSVKGWSVEMVSFGSVIVIQGKMHVSCTLRVCLVGKRQLVP